MLPGLTEKEINGLRFSVGQTTRARRPFSPVEVSELCAKSIGNGANPKKIATALQISEGMLSKFLPLKDLALEIRHLVSWGYSGDGAIGFSVAALLTRLPAVEQEIASSAILKNRITKTEMMSVIQLLERSKEPLEACVNRVILRRPIVRVQQIVLGAVTSIDSKTKLRSLSQLERDELLQQIICRQYPDAKDFTAKLGADRFAIIGGKSIAQTVAMDARLEQNINNFLEEKLS